MSEKTTKILLAIVLMGLGIGAMTSPGIIFSLILDLALVIFLAHGAYEIWKGIHSSSYTQVLQGGLSAGIGILLLFNTFIPEWIIRVFFGMYSSLIGLSLLIQQMIHIYDEVRTSMTSWILTIAYLVIGILLLFTPHISTQLLIQFFGVYFFVLGFRYLLDGIDVDSATYAWKRAFHLSLPVALSALLPEWTLNQINQHFKEGKDVKTVQFKSEEEPILKAMVHIGPDGFQKVGHFSFAYKGIVYSYGNYDHDSDKLGGTIGDGVYFNVPFERYLPNIMKYEHNTIFEYGIHLSKEQEEYMNEKLDELFNNSYRWYSNIEKEDGHGRLEEYESDYACRLHQRTGAKFYKLKKGRFKTYWAMGENCVLFADQFLGTIGAGILSVRGIVTPGAYFDYLQNEYQKENSPVVKCVIHPYRMIMEQEESRLLEQNS